MDKREAEELLALIERDAQTGPVAIRQIGNLEYVVVVTRSGYHLWGLADYRNYLDAKEAEREVKCLERSKEKGLVAV